MRGSTTHERHQAATLGQAYRVRALYATPVRLADIIAAAQCMQLACYLVHVSARSLTVQGEARTLLDVAHSIVQRVNRQAHLGADSAGLGLE